MSDRVRNKVVVILTGLVIYGFLLWGIVLPDEDVSFSERRPLKQLPTLHWETVIKGEFMASFEEYALDQFPLRDTFRKAKMYTSLYALGQKDNNDIYTKEGYAVKIDYPLDTNSIDYATQRFRFVYERFFAEHKGEVYLAVIPDKNLFLAEKYGYPYIDFEALVEDVRAKMEYATYIDLSSFLSLSDYYFTDIHWRQEKLIEVARQLAAGMGVTLTKEYQKVKVEEPFLGVYYGQTAPVLPAEDMYYLENDVLNQCKVFDYETNQYISVYDLDKLQGRDPYQMYLSGSKSLLTIENLQATTEKELIVFRDSFGSSLLPLLAEGYQKITLVDIRYISPMMLDRFIVIGDQDVLFLYSTPVLNHSMTIK